MKKHILFLLLAISTITNAQIKGTENYQLNSYIISKYIPVNDEFIEVDKGSFSSNDNCNIISKDNVLILKIGSEVNTFIKKTNISAEYDATNDIAWSESEYFEQENGAKMICTRSIQFGMKYGVFRFFFPATNTKLTYGGTMIEFTLD